jgi:hypothetical protein
VAQEMFNGESRAVIAVSDNAQSGQNILGK